MREILFRGKSTNGIGWVEGSLRILTIQPADDAPFKQYEIEDTTLGVFPNDFMSGICETVEPETVGQFTGLTDKNGTKIFDGDIVVFRTRTSTFKPLYVRWYAETAQFLVTTNDCVRSYPMDRSWEYEVIGNIHDNPELLRSE